MISACLILAVPFLVGQAEKGPPSPSLEEQVRALLHIQYEDGLSNQRRAVSHALTGLGKKDRALLQRLDALQKEIDRLQAQAAEMLLSMGREQPAVIAVLIKLLDSKEILERIHAAGILGRIGPRSKQALPVLDRIFADERDEAANMAGSAMSNIGSAAIPYLLKGLESKDDDRRRKCLGRLAAIDDVAKDPRLLWLLVEYMEENNKELRSIAQQALVNLGKRSMASLKKALRHKQPRVRAGAAAAMAEIDESAHAEILPVLRASLKHEDIVVREQAAQGFYHLGKLSLPAVDDLIGTLNDQSHWVRSTAAFVLGELGPDAEKATSGLAQALFDEEISVREAAVGSLANIGRNPKVVVPALLKYLKEFLGNPVDDDAILLAMAALGRFGKEAKAALPFLETFMDHENLVLRLTAAAAVQQIKRSP